MEQAQTRTLIWYCSNSRKWSTIWLLVTLKFLRNPSESLSKSKSRWAPVHFPNQLLLLPLQRLHKKLTVVEHIIGNPQTLRPSPSNRWELPTMGPDPELLLQAWHCKASLRLPRTINREFPPLGQAYSRILTGRRATSQGSSRRYGEWRICSWLLGY